MKKAGLEKGILVRDNDPVWSSAASESREAAMPWETKKLPPRSPDLNPCDYGLWDAILRTMKKHEDEVLGDATEKQADYWARLETTALGLSEASMKKLCGSMARRMKELTTNGGFYIKSD